MINVLISDKGSPDYYKNEEYFATIDAWAQKHCPSYVGYHVQDVSDVSYEFDEIACFEFRNEKCANWFILRWNP